ncbi:MAG TPA: Ig-like domain-containing protein [Lentimicrobium sp.]|nr:Ig-like domain-containing protein [Lentimicrobium sp.]
MIYTYLIKKKNLIHIGLLALLAVSCANPVSPTGGPKDETPPEVTRTTPPNLSTNFTGNEITLYFNEFINLKDINSQLIISPPVKEPPEFHVRGKSLIAEFKDPWRKETTYNIFFGDAIVDITENNPLSGYKFTFSTGDVLDSMIIKGKVINAFNLTPVKGAYVMLYDSIYDSVPYKQIPYYISKTKETGEFELSNLRNIQYLIFGLTDLNANYMFDMSNEEISFIDTLISPWNLREKDTKPFMIGNTGDSLQGNLNSLSKKADTTAVDSVVVTILGNDSIAVTDTIPAPLVQDTTVNLIDSLPSEVREERYIQLFHFKEADSVQRLLKTQLLRENVISFQFKVPVKKPAFDLLNDVQQVKPVIGYNTSKDTLTMWLPGYDADSIRIKVTDDLSIVDTIEMSVKPKAKKNDAGKKQPLKISNNIISGRIKPGSSIKLTFSDPVESYNFSGIRVKEDSILLSDYSIKFIDSLKRQLEISYAWEPDIQYSVTIQDSTITGIMGTNTDSTRFSFMVLKEEETAKLSLTVDLPENTPYIIQLLDTKEKILTQYLITEDITINIPYLTPGKYKIKAIDDKNANGYWDTGKYLLGRYPERVIYFTKELDLRANWTLDETWKIPESGQ